MRLCDELHLTNGKNVISLGIPVNDGNGAGKLNKQRFLVTEYRLARLI